MANSTNRKLLSQYLLGNQAGNLGASFVPNSSAFDNVNDVSVANSATVSRNTTTPLTKESDFAIALPNNTSGSVTWALATLDRSLSGGNCLFSFIYTAASMGSNVVAQVLQGANVVATSLPLGASTTPVIVQLNAPCGDLSSSTTVRIANTTGNTGTSAIRVANVTYGNATNLTNVSQAEMFGISKISGCTSFWNTTSTSFATFGTQTGCSYAVEGNAQAPATNIPAMTFASLPAGEYFLTYDGNFGNTNSGSYACLYEVYDGTNEWRERATVESALTGPDAFRGSTFTSSFKYDTAQSNITLQIRARTTDGAKGCSLYGSTGSPGVLKLYRFPTGSQKALSVNTIGWKIDANISGANPSLGTSTVSSYTEITSSSLTLTNNAGNGNIAAQIPCSGTNPPTGTTCSVGDESVGVSFDLPAAGDVLACVSFAWKGTVGGQSGDEITPTFQIVETPNNAQTISQQGKSRIQNGTGKDPTNPDNPYHVDLPNRLCGTFSFSSVGQKTLRLMYEQVATNALGSVLLADASSSNGQRDIHWEVYPLNQQVPAPVLVGSVTSNSSGLERIERARIGHPTSIDSQSGSWITSVTNPGTGSYVINIAAGIFSGTPVCTFTGVTGYQHNTASISSTSVTVDFWNRVGSTQLDTDFGVICMGPR